MTLASDRAGSRGILRFLGRSARGRPPVDKFWDEPDIAPAFKIGAWIALGVLLIPVFIVVLAGLNAGDFLTFPPDGLSLRWVISFLTSEKFLGAYLFSLQLALMSMAISTTIGTFAAIFLARVDFPGLPILRAFFLSPLMLPGIVLGLALYVFYVTTYEPLTGIRLQRTLWGLTIGHVLATMPYVIGAVSAALFNFDETLEEAARSLGAGPFKAFMKVTLPNIAPGVMAGAIFAFIVSFGQFEVSLFLSAANLEPLPIATYISLRYKFEPIAAAAGIFAIALVVVSMVITSRLISLKRFSGIKFS
jgi:putative spermidine/putrescine transport system permease protein